MSDSITSQVMTHELGPTFPIPSLLGLAAPVTGGSGGADHLPSPPADLDLGISGSVSGMVNERENC